MHKIISTTGASIEFTLTSDKSFVIDPVNPIEVSDEELLSLQERLGSQISEVSDEEKSDPTAEEIAAKEQADKDVADASATSEDDVPVVKTYKVISENGVAAGLNNEIVPQEETFTVDDTDENLVSSVEAWLSEGLIEEVVPEA